MHQLLFIILSFLWLLCYEIYHNRVLALHKCSYIFDWNFPQMRALLLKNSFTLDQPSKFNTFIIPNWISILMASCSFLSLYSNLWYFYFKLKNCFCAHFTLQLEARGWTKIPQMSLFCFNSMNNLLNYRYRYRYRYKFAHEKCLWEKIQIIFLLCEVNLCI